MKNKTKIKSRVLTGILLCSMLILVMTKPGYAQFEYGIKLGAGAACQSELLDIADNCDIRFSSTIGLMGKYQFSEGIALKSGLEYQQKGRNFDENETAFSNNLHYISIPVKAQFSAGEKAGFKKDQRIYFAVGPYLSYLVDANSKFNEVKYDLKDDTRNFDFGLGIEIGFEFPVFTDKALQLGINYDMGFIEIYKNEDYKDLHNKLAYVSLGLLF